MARYTVHVPTGDALPREAALERAVFVRDGWSWGAFAFGPLWLFWHRHWVSGLIGLILFGVILGGISALPVAPWAKSFSFTLLSVLWGLEGASLRRLALRRAGHIEEGLVVGDKLDELEQRYFAEGGLMDAPVLPNSAAPIAAPITSLPVIGLFPDSRKHP